MQYLLQGFAREEPKHLLIEELLSEVDRINGTIGGLLSLSRTGDFKPQELDLLDPLERAVKLVQAEAAEHGVEMELRLRGQGHRVRGDPGPLKQLFLNLLLNAIQSMPQGGRLTVEILPWVPRNGGEPWVEIRVADTGPGIAPEHLRRVFDPFFTTKPEGTGLGLAICHSIVAQHQGEIQIESEPGRGAAALVRLPTV
jgi:two-component system sensor histidine kinase HydH